MESINKKNVKNAMSNVNELSAFFALSTMLNNLFKRSQNLVQHASVERMFTLMLKPFKWAFMMDFH